MVGFPLKTGAEFWNWKPCVVGKITPSHQMYLCPNAPNLWIATLYEEKTLIDILLRILRWGDYPGLPRWTQCNHKSPCKRVSRGRFDERRGWGDVTMKAESGVILFEDGRSHKPKNIDSHWKQKKQGNRPSLQSHQKEPALLTPRL